MNNRMWNCKNPHQGERKKVLCLCSAGLLRSPTAAVLLSQEPYNFNTRAAGLDIGHALIPVDDVLLTWADEIIVMERRQVDQVMDMLPEASIKQVVCLGIEDDYAYMDEVLVQVMKDIFEEEYGN